MKLNKVHWQNGFSKRLEEVLSEKTLVDKLMNQNVLCVWAYFKNNCESSVIECLIFVGFFFNLPARFKFQKKNGGMCDGYLGSNIFVVGIFASATTVTVVKVGVLKFLHVKTWKSIFTFTCFFAVQILFL